jgi:hypothetical protein
VEKAVVILGAGASYDVSNGSTPIKNGAYRPPVARYLFKADFWNIRQQYTGAVVFGTNLGSSVSLQQNTFNLEEQLTDYANHPNPVVRRHFLDVPPYLRDLLNACTSNYVDIPDNYIQLVRLLLQEQTHEIMFIVLNYDTLLEKAILSYDRAFSMHSFDDYINSDRQASVIEVHGSTNWGIPMGQVNRAFLDELDRFEPRFASRAFSDSDIVIEDSINVSTVDWNHQGTRLYPRLSAPIREKTFVCPVSHQIHLMDFVSDCHKFLIIGTSGLDEDLLTALSKACSASPGHVVHYVGDGSVSQVQERFEAAILPFKMVGPSQPPPRLFSAGFNNYVGSGEIRAFLTAG